MTYRAKSVLQLLGTYAEILEELRARGVTRSANNPVADYAEHLCEQALSLHPAVKSTKGFDAIDARGLRYQIKGRRLTRHNDSRQLGVLRDLGEKPFDFLVGVLFSEDFRVFRACSVPIAQIRKPNHAAYVSRTNSWRFVLHDDVWKWKGVKDVTRQLAKAQEKHAL